MMLKEKCNNVADIEIKDALFVYAFVSLSAGIIAAILECLDQDATYILELAGQGIAGSLSYFICTFSLFALFISKLSDSKHRFTKKLNDYLFSCINVGVVSGLVSTTVAGCLGLGACVVFHLVGTSEQFLSAFNVVIYAAWFLLMFYPVIYLYKKMIGAWKVLADIIAGIYFIFIMYLSVKYGISDGDEISILFVQLISGGVIFLFLIYYKKQRVNKK